MPDFKTIADFRKDNGEPSAGFAASSWCCAPPELFSEASVAIDGSKFKAVNTRDRNFTQARCSGGWRRLTRALPGTSHSLTAPDRQGETVPEAKITRLNEKIATLREEIQRLKRSEHPDDADRDKQISLTDPDAARWPQVGEAAGWSGTMFKVPSTPSIYLIVTHEVTNVGLIGASYPAWPSRRAQRLVPRPSRL